MKFSTSAGRPEKDNAIDQYLEESLSDAEFRLWKENFVKPPQVLSSVEKQEWLSTLKGVSIASDAFFPFRDNIDRAYQCGVSYIVQPGGSVRDDAVIDACNEYGMTMAFSNIRLFHH
jgi:phosphoribosylaminoimidazolecarboxamide formyltransferase/IMP cyclohydrolase